MLALLAHGAEIGAHVTLDGDRYWRMRGPDAEQLVSPGPRVERRTLVLSGAEGGVRIDARWHLDADEPGWLSVPLVGSGSLVQRLTWRGRDVGIDRDGTLVLWVDGPGDLVLSALHQGRVAPGEGPRLGLLGAASGTAILPESWAVTEGLVPLGGGRWWGSGGELALEGRSADPADRGAVLGATVATGVTVGEGVATMESRVQVTALRGAIATVQLSVPGAGADLTVEGPAVASTERVGSDVTVQLHDAATSARLILRWTVPVTDAASSTLAAPVVRVQGVRNTAWVTKLARDGDVEVVPEGWKALALAEVPDWAEGLVSGTTTAALSSGRAEPLTLSLLRFEPVPGPATLIDVAQTGITLSDEGRMILRSHLQVRNDRGAFLRVTPPPGATIVGVSVGGEVPDPLVDGESWRIPLAKSVETIDGLLTFPVRVVMVGPAPELDGRTTASLPLPAFDADIAVHRVSVHLPRGHTSRLDPDERHVVESFSEGDGITYGFAVGDARASEADALFQQAVGQWMANDFDDAQSTLDVLKDMGAGNQDIERLQGNLDLLYRDDDQDGDSASARRVKEQAKARSMEESREQARLVEQADEALLVGDYQAAQSAYGQALAIGDKLQRLDAGEDQSNAYNNAEVAKKLATSSSLSKQKSASEERAKRVPSKAAEEEEQRREEEARRRAEEERRRVAEERVRAEAERKAYEAAEAAREREPEASPEALEEDAWVVEQESRRRQGESYQERTVIDFEGLDISGDLVKPDGALLLEESDDLSMPGQSTEGVPGGMDGVVFEGRLGGVGANEPVEEEVEAEPVVVGRSQQELLRMPVAEKRGKKISMPSFGGKNKDKTRTREEYVEIEIDEEDVVGELVKPEGSLLLDRRRASFGSGADPATEDTSRSTVLTKGFLEQVPAGRSYQSAVSTSAGVQKPTRRWFGRRFTEESGAPAPPAESIDIAMGGEDEPPDVKVTSLDVILPSPGETVRFQHLLVPAGQQVDLPIHTRPDRRRR